MSLLAATGLAVASAWAVYGVGTALILAGAIGVVALRNPVHCALGLVTTIFGVALMFIDEGAYFLAAVQVIVYAGAIVILFLFVIMLLGVDKREPRAPADVRSLGPIAAGLGLVAVVELLVLARVHYWAAGAKATTEALSGPGADVQKLGQSIFTSYLLPFEMTSALLVIAVVAAVALVRKKGAPPPQTPARKPAGAIRPPAPSPADATSALMPSARQPAATAGGAPAASSPPQRRAAG